MLNENKEKAANICLSSDDLLMKPFALGWTREVVNRVIARNRNLNCDIYYFSPSGKKIRSLTEIKANLTDGLTPECFSFKRQPLGIDENYETVRDARVKRKGNENFDDSKYQKKGKKEMSPNSQKEEAMNTKRRSVKKSSSSEKKSRNQRTLKENIESESMPFIDKYDKIKERTQNAKRVTKTSNQNININSIQKNKSENISKQNIRSKRKHEGKPGKINTSKQTKIIGNKQLSSKIVRKKGNISKNRLTKSQLFSGKNVKEVREKTKVNSPSKRTKKILNQETSKIEGKAEGEEEDNKSMTKDLRSIVKKNIGKYRELREKQKLAIISEIKTKGRKIGVKSTKRTRSEPISKNKQLYLKPLEKGWKRELVFRKNCAKAGQHADVYYFHPNGKKLRSCREIAENLTQGLTIEYFTFRKEPIGCGEPSEVIREARSHTK